MKNHENIALARQSFVSHFMTKITQITKNHEKNQVHF
jgi:hypothetical protein